MSYVATSGPYVAPARGRKLIDWGSVFAGAVWALAITVLLSSLWLALGYASHVAAIRDNIQWYLAGSAMLALLVGGFVAGWFPGVRGWVPGLVNGMTVWGLMLTVSLLVGLPSVIGGAAAFGGNILGTVTGNAVGHAARTTLNTGLWAGFWTALIGLVLAALGGAIGGATRREDATVQTVDHDERRMDVVEDRPDVGRTGTESY